MILSEEEVFIISIGKELASGEILAADEQGWIESKGLQELLDQLRKEHPGLLIYAYENSRFIELTGIEVAEKGRGVGTKVIERIQDYARQVNKPIVLRPEPELRKKAALFRFYKNLGFVINKGRKKDYTLSSPFALTMYWRP